MKASSSPAAPRAATRAAGVSQARTTPACMSEIRSQRIASFMKWVEMKIVTCFSRERSMSSSQNSSRATGSTPDVGSSRISISGSWMIATARESRWRTPSGSDSGRSSTCDSSPKRSTSSSIRAAIDPGGR